MSFLSSLAHILHSILAWPLFVLLFCSHMVISLFVFILLPKPQIYVHKLSVVVLSLIFKLGGVRSEVSGIENIPKEGAFVLMTNHQSVVDIPILLNSIPRYGCFIAKRELKKVPFLGLSMILQGHFFIDRKNTRKAIKDMSKIAEDVVRREVILLVFPEGTRSKSGKLGAFKLGSFKIATEQGIPILPCCITGAREILPKKKLMFRPGKLKIEYGKPIPVEALGDDATKFEHKKMAESLSKKVRSAILDLGAEE